MTLIYNITTCDICHGQGGQYGDERHDDPTTSCWFPSEWYSCTECHSLGILPTGYFDIDDSEVLGTGHFDKQGFLDYFSGFKSITTKIFSWSYSLPLQESFVELYSYLTQKQELVEGRDFWMFWDDEDDTMNFKFIREDDFILFKLRYA